MKTKSDLHTMYIGADMETKDLYREVDELLCDFSDSPKKQAKHFPRLVELRSTLFYFKSLDYL